MCRHHYDQWRAAQPPGLRPYRRRDGECCAADCAEPRFAAGFCRIHYDRNRRHGHLDGHTATCEACGRPYKPHGRQRWCDTCCPTDQARGRMRRYGISERDYHVMLACQDGLCAICRMRSPTDVDHYHETGRVRGLLCSPCNTRLHAVDNAAWLEAALNYVKGR